jgi:biopolymer transport protein ExbD
MTTATKTGPHAEINITPLIDVMLVLLVIFMLVAPATQRVLGAGLPRPGGPQGGPPTALVVTVEAEVFRLDDQPLAGAPALEGALREALQARRDRTVLVRVAGEVPYARVVAALDSARGAGASRLGVLGTAAPCQNRGEEAPCPGARPAPSPSI